MVQKFEFSLQSKHDALDLGVTMFVPEQPQGILQIVHGMAEHRRRYYDFMQFCAERGLVVIIHDHRGHGDSVRRPEDYGYMYENGADGLVEDTHLITTYVRQHFSGLPLTILGHSMGSLIARCYMKKYDQDVDGLIVCGSPSSRGFSLRLARFLVRFLKLFQGGHHRNKFIANQFNRTIARKYRHEGSPNSWIASDPAVVAAYEADDKSGFDFTLNGYDTLFTLSVQAYSRKGWGMKHPTVPIFFIAGADDPCIISAKKFQQAVNFMQKVGYQHVISKLYLGMRHEILNERGKLEVWNDVGSWIWTQVLGR